MNTHSFARRVSALVLVIGIPVVGTPFPAHAAGERPASLTFNGRPLSWFLNSRVPGDPVPLRVDSGQPDGQISGVLLDKNEQPLAGRQVELDRPTRMWEGRLVTATDASGGFSFLGLGPGRYEVQYRVDGRVAATTGPILLTTDAKHVTRIRVLNSGEQDGGRGLSQAKKAGIAAAVLGAIGVYYYTLLVYGMR